MIIGVGIDLLDISRMKKDLKGKSGLREELFTAEEIEYCEKKRYPEQHYAVRFCAKEAFFKASGIGSRGGLTWKEIRVTHTDLGLPDLHLVGKALETAEKLGVKKIHLSLSHTRTTAAAVVILEST